VSSAALAPPLRNTNLRLFERWPVAPAWPGAATFAALAGLYFTLVALFDWEPRRGGDWTYELVMCAIAASAATGAAYALRSAQSAAEALRPQLSGDTDEIEAAIAGLPRFDRLQLRTLVAFGFALGTLAVSTRLYWVGPVVGRSDPLFLYNLAKMGLVCWLAARMTHVEVALALRLSRIGERFAPVELFHPEPLAPLARAALRSVLRFMLLTALVSVMLLGPWPKELAVFAIALALAAAAVALLLPVLGVHRRLAARKRAALSGVRSALRDAARDALARPRDPAATSRAADLLALESRLVDAPTWPFDFPMLLRFALYVGIGAGSWIGSALVERALDRVVG
jgi:hypothetical protein